MMADARTAERVRALAPLPTAENCWDSLVGLPRPAVRFCLALLAACINERREEAESTGSENRGRHAKARHSARNTCAHPHTHTHTQASL